MKLRSDYILDGMVLAVMTFIVLMILSIFQGCQTAPVPVATIEAPSAPVSAPEVVAPVTAPPVDDIPVSILSWDKTNAERLAWSKALIESIDEHWAKFSKSKDMKRLCANYANLENPKLAWAEMFVAIAFFESTWNPASRYFEKTMGYHSEGLFQMSYVDEPWTKCGFDAAKKNALDPIVNTKCAVKVLARQIDKSNLIMMSKGAYWAVIKDGSRYQKISQIKARIEAALPQCKTN